ncbi:hypothetical protein EGW08_000223 [Elysia chlorotica]|uniref:Ubiquitin-like domain-containing protein n=1 Tax=Elysia chlorotica TaxID=188477 RepID=A0A3S1A6T3_ELYCH|nr:hypothetical protein EGW08_000223 [Elysia chlorotica]
MFAAMDQALPADMPITLVIKAPNQRMADQTVDCMLGWTIRKLKQHLEVVYPSKPKHNEQRLIYSGKLLQDHLTLKEVLRQYDENEQLTRHTVHLVCSKSCDSATSSVQKSSKEQMNASSKENTPPGEARTSSSDIQSTVNTTTQQQNTAQNPATDGLRFRGTSAADARVSQTASQSQLEFMNMYGAYPAPYGTYTNVPTSMAGPAGYTPDQYAWLMQQQQQAYSQYMMQYMQYYQNAYFSGHSFNPQMAAPPTYTQQQPVLNPAAQQQQPQPPQAAARPNNDANDMPRMNAQGGIDQDDENDLEPRDWLHHVYFIMRFLTFMGFLFFYSNPTRFLLVSSGSIAIYLLQKIRRHMQRMQQDQERQQQEAERQRQQAEQHQQDHLQQQADGTTPNDGNGSGQQQEEQHQAQDAAVHGNPGVQNARSETVGTPPETETDDPRQEQEQGNWVIRAFVFVCMTIQAFFTSLLPTPPELLEAN